MSRARYEYGEAILPGVRVEISPHFDLWMHGARYGTVVQVSPEKKVASVRMDHGQIIGLRTFPLDGLQREGWKE